jgi:formiminotetrahydrofolate cyclodeaminase
MYTDGQLIKYLDDLASRLPAPGGGSASAMVSAAGVALLCMVSNFTVDKKGYEQYQDEIKSLLAQLEQYRHQLTKLVDLDVDAYQKISGVYKLPKNTDVEKQARDRRMQEVLKEAMDVPLQIMVVSNDVLQNTALKLCRIGNKQLITDVACGVLFLQAGIDGAK